MKRAIEALNAAAHRLERQALRDEQTASQTKGTSMDGDWLGLARRAREEAAELDAAIKLLEAASAVRELVRAVRADRDAHAAFHAATAGAHDTADAADNWPELLGECQRASLALDAALADPTLRALIDESAAGAGGDDG